MKILLRLMLAALLVHLAPAFAQSPKKAVASPALQKEFDDFIARFRAALKANDSTAVADMTRLPFEADPLHSRRRAVSRKNLSVHLHVHPARQGRL